MLIYLYALLTSLAVSRSFTGSSVGRLLFVEVYRSNDWRCKTIHFYQPACLWSPHAMTISIIHEGPNNASLFHASTVKVTCVFSLPLTCSHTMLLIDPNCAYSTSNLPRLKAFFCPTGWQLKETVSRSK